MDVSFSQTPENYQTESPARLEESLYADEQPKKRIRASMETHSKLAETVGIENTIMLNPEDLAKAGATTTRNEDFNRDFNKNFGVQTRQHFGVRMRGPGLGNGRQPYNSPDSSNDIANSPSTSLPETRTSVIRGMLSRGQKTTENEPESDMESSDHFNLRCYEQVEKDNGEHFVRNRHYFQNSDNNRMETYTTQSENAGHISEKFTRATPISSNRPFMETRQPYFMQQVHDSAYRVPPQHPPEFGLSQMDSRGKQYFERPGLMTTQIPSSAMIQEGFSGLNPKFNIPEGLFVQSHERMQSGFPGFAVHDERTTVSSENLPKNNNLPTEQAALKANVKGNPSPIGKIDKEETSARHSSLERDIGNQGTSNSSKQLDNNKNIKGKRGGKVDSNIQCAQCLKKFGSSSALAKHKATHSDERKYICSLCKKGFKRQDHLNGHMMTHRDKKPYKCKYCEKSYCDHRSLKKHYENCHPNPEQLQPVSTSAASHQTDTERLRAGKLEPGRFTPERDESRASPLSSKQEVPQGSYSRKRNSDSMCSNNSACSDDLGRSHSPHVSFDIKSVGSQSAVSMLKQVIDSHEHKKENHPLEGGYPRPGFFPYPEGFQPQWYHQYQAQMMNFMKFNQQPPMLVQANHLGQMNPYCPTDPPQLVPSYPPVSHNVTSQANEGTTDSISRTNGRKGDNNGYQGNKDHVIATDPTSIAIANAKDQQGEPAKQPQLKDGNTPFPHVVQWKTVAVGKENNGVPPQSMGNSPAANMMPPDHKLKRPAELNIHIPSTQAAKRPHEMVTTTEHQAKRRCPPPPSPASLNMAEGLLKLADVSIKSEHSGNHDNVFKNPPSTPPRKPKPRPAPINISPCSNQFGPMSPPIYTPPPMLSPHSIFHTPRCGGSTPLTPAGRFFLAGNRSRKNSVEDDSGEVPAEVIIPEPKINIGASFQAEVALMTEPRSDLVYDKHRAAVCWIPFEHETRKRIQEIEAFLDMACSVAVYGGGSNKEYALHVLYRLKGNIKLAVRHILGNKSAIQKKDGLADYHYEGSERWTSKERLKFREAHEKNGKNFHVISKEIGTKSVQQCVEFYYLWKASRPEGMRSRRGYAETESEQENEEDFSDNDGETTYIFECDFPECNSKFISRQALNGHIRVHGGSFMKPSEPKRTKVKTMTSSDSSSSSVSVSTNVSRAATKPPRPSKPHSTPVQPVPNADGTLPEFPCKVCGRIFHKIKSRSAHMKTHVKRNDDDHAKSKS